MSRAEVGDRVEVLAHEHSDTVVFSGEVEGFTDGTDRVAIVIGPCGPCDPSGFREVGQERLRVMDDD